MKIKDRILSQHRADPTPKTTQQWAALLGLSKPDMPQLNTTLKALQQQGLLTLPAAGHKRKRRTPGRVVQQKQPVGQLLINRRGYGVVIDQNGKRYTIPAHALGQALHKDVVCLQRLNHNTAIIERVVQPASRVFCGIVEATPGGLYLRPEDGRYSFALRLDGRQALYLQPETRRLLPAEGQQGGCYLADCAGQLAVAALDGDLWQDRTGTRTGNGRLVCVLGDPQLAQNRMWAVAYQNGLPTDYPQEALQQAEQISPNPEDWLNDNLQDHTHKQIFTIDGADAQDLDDAICLERDGQHWVLSVYIADVSYFVTPNSPLDAEAQRRGTSAYLPGLTLHMLPKALCAGVCSLLPGQLRRAMCVRIVYDAQGTPLNTEFMRCKIATCARLTYEQVNRLFDSPAGCTPEGLEGLQDALRSMLELSEILGKKRQQAGALDFELAETAVSLHPDGRVDELTARVQGKAEKLIENFMLSANQAVAERLTQAGYPLLYRVHDKPEAQKLADFLQLARENGVTCPKQLDADGLPALVQSLRQHPRRQLLFQQLLRALPKAVYQPQNIGHFGLGNPCYCHFTSPIRRYPDLLVHRMLGLLLNHQPADAVARQWHGSMQALGVSTSQNERRAMQAEWQAIDIRRAEWLAGHLGQEFEGVVCRVLAGGFFVQLPNTAEGYVSCSALGYRTHYDGLSQSLIATNGRSITLGMPCRVVVAHVDVSTGRADFAPADDDQGSGRHA